MSFHYIFRYIIVGDAGVGKSSILFNFLGQKFREDYSSTIGVEFAYRQATINQRVIRFYVADTTGQERFISITRSYYRYTAGALVVYDITKRESFVHIQRWLGEVKEHCDREVMMILIGSKCDLEAEREVSYKEGEALARENKMLFLETSAKLGKNIEQAFEKSAEFIISKLDKGVIEPRDALGIKTGNLSDNVHPKLRLSDPTVNQNSNCAC